MIADYWKDPEFLERHTHVVNGTTYYNEDEAIKEYFLLRPEILAVVIPSYLAFIFKIGPDFMEKRKPMDIKRIMTIYNAVQAGLNFWFFITGIVWVEAISHVCGSVCTAVEKNTTPFGIWFMGPWVSYLGLKYLDLLDTVFMVLRKKYSHITVLHVYHHTAMVVTTWYLAVYYRDDHSIILAMINLFVHVVMYSYYLLSNFGPNVRRAIAPYKIIITRMQILQFLIFLSLLFTLFLLGCDIRTGYLLMMGTNVTIFLVLFLNFYKKAYSGNKEKTKKDKKEKPKEKAN